MVLNNSFGLLLKRSIANKARRDHTECWMINADNDKNTLITFQMIYFEDGLDLGVVLEDSRFVDSVENH